MKTNSMDRLFDNLMRLYLTLLAETQTNLEQIQVDKTISASNPQVLEENQKVSTQTSYETSNVDNDSNNVICDTISQSEPLPSNRNESSSTDHTNNRTELNFVIVSASTISEKCYSKVKRGRGRPRKNTLNNNNNTNK
ncbi:predicted protein [Naegleria gruberi]|uniref:Predicted protein n=1 Tax=Naegleria gruberi TaxID=5762 RepID=D2VW41_NAEGR|nr:uncharacterized protein NAEGRDRAFT_73240 [Naegleria gruberi]EFC38949.1 predicted protein [Naegleria gruberi]|eukprot:XP_002671693.1 predicted protein [Naegleria gruberi strain NEG-M]